MLGAHCSNSLLMLCTHYVKHSCRAEPMRPSLRDYALLPKSTHQSAAYAAQSRLFSALSEESFRYPSLLNIRVARVQ
jgi:hypothetical protein